MTLNKSARYAIYAALEMALGDGRPVTVAGVAARYGIPATALAKVLQQLVRARLASGSRGIGGGYRLAQPASKISVLDIVALFDPPRPPGECLLRGACDKGCVNPKTCSVHGLFDEVDELVRCTFASVSLETLARRERRSARYTAEPS
jgi:Rrf2 family iron-sulfur cluster assembly transcriptional regulator